MSRALLSIAVAMYNEADALDAFFSTMQTSLRDLPVDYEIICVNDGSQDDTLPRLEEYAKQDSRIKVVALSRNFGKEAAMTAALDFANGDAVLPIDADLQDPPELIEEMVAKWQEGYEVVHAKRVSREADSLVKRNSAGWFYRIFNRLSEIKIPENVGDFRLMDRKVVDAIKLLPEKDRFMKGLFCWPGFSQTVVEFERHARSAGESKFNYWRLWNFALSGITSFSTMPIRAGVYLGLLVSAFAFIFGVYIIAETLVTGVDVPGYASLLVVTLFLGGIQLFFLGLLGEYIGRIYLEVKNRPIYLVAKTVGVKKPREHNVHV